MLQLYRAGMNPGGDGDGSGPPWIPVELEMVTKLWLPDTEILRLKGFHRLSVLDRLQVSGTLAGEALESQGDHGGQRLGWVNLSVPLCFRAGIPLGQDSWMKCCKGEHSLQLLTFPIFNNFAPLSIHATNVVLFCPAGSLDEHAPRRAVRGGDPHQVHVPDELRKVPHGQADLQIPGKN